MNSTPTANTVDEFNKLRTSSAIVLSSHLERALARSRSPLALPALVHQNCRNPQRRLTKRALETTTVCVMETQTHRPRLARRWMVGSGE